jgi:hypothetical protein
MRVDCRLKVSHSVLLFFHEDPDTKSKERARQLRRSKRSYTTIDYPGQVS